MEQIVFKNDYPNTLTSKVHQDKHYKMLSHLVTLFIYLSVIVSMQETGQHSGSNYHVSIDWN